jgi:hypothetical protein
MVYRLIEWNGLLYIVVGIGFDHTQDPPDVFYAVPLEDTLFSSVLLNIDFIRIPFSEALEITDQNRIRAIWILYGK